MDSIKQMTHADFTFLLDGGIRKDRAAAEVSGGEEYKGTRWSTNVSR